MRIVWTPEATTTYENELHYILDRFGARVALSFAKNTLHCIHLIQQGLIDAPYSKSTNAYFLVLSKQSTLVYRWNTDKSQLIILLFWNNKRDPKGLDIKQ